VPQQLRQLCDIRRDPCASIKAQSGGVSTRRFEAGLLAIDFVFG
jgi:hypothetical protein